MRHPRRLLPTVAVAATVVVLPTMLSAPAQAGLYDDKVDRLVRAVQTDAVLEHIEAFQEIADANGGNRADQQPGYAASVDYVVDQLEEAGYTPEVQEFGYDVEVDTSTFERTAPDSLAYADEDFNRTGFDNPVSGPAAGPIEAVDLVVPFDPAPNTSTSGCEPADFDGFTPGNVALLQRGTCPFVAKVQNAQDAGAAAVVIFNEGQPGRTGAITPSGDGTGLTIPSVFTTYDVGVELATTPGAAVALDVSFEVETRTSYNVLAQTSFGDPDNVVMVGAHLDSVPEGAGVSDNGSGSAAVLEAAIQANRTLQSGNNALRFAWWGAEELGLIGSEEYVAGLSAEEVDDIALYLNFDMIASPNYTLGIYDGDNSTGTAADGFIPEGSAEIEDVFQAFYADAGQPFVDSIFSGRSDYGPFIAVDIPAGGLFTGAGDAKTEEEAALFGGVAGVPKDLCYHTFCDNLRGDGQDPAIYAQLAADYELVGNVNIDALAINSDAVAAAVAEFAYDTSAVNGVVPQDLGTDSLGDLLLADDSGFDDDSKDFDVTRAAALAVLDAKPDSAVGLLLDGSVPLTAFLPRDSAFVDLARDASGSPVRSEAEAFDVVATLGPDAIEGVLLYHVLPGVPVTMSDLEGLDGEALTMASGEMLDVVVETNSRGFDYVTFHDRDADNGDAVIVKSGINAGNRQQAFAINTVVLPLDL